MNVIPSEVLHREFYRILIGAVAPRPIAWVSTKVGPFTVRSMIQGLLIHMFLIGLPISFSLRKFGTR